MAFREDIFIKMNNLVYGENTRERNLVRHSDALFLDSHFSKEKRDAFIYKTLFRGATAGLYITPNPNYVLGEDNSHWDGIVDYSKTKSKGMIFTFIKVTDGTVSTKYWDINYPNAVKYGMATGSYHWLYRDANVSCKAQANATWNRVKTQPRQLPTVVDFEWTYWGGVQSNPNWNDLDIWVTEYTRLSGEKPILYTAAGYANTFGQIPASLKSKLSALWIANYGVSSPALPMGFTTWQFWQFIASLEQAYWSPSSVNKRELDGNYWWQSSKALYEFANMSATTPPPIEPPVEPSSVTTYPFNGITRTVGRYANSDFYMTVLDPTKVRVEVVHDPSGDGLARPSDICRQYGASMAWNGDEYDKRLSAVPHKPVEYAMSNGQIYVTRSTAVPSMNIAGIKAEIGHGTFSLPKNITSGYRYLLQGGLVQPYLSGSEIQYTEEHPRSCFGLTQDGKILSLTIDGRSSKSAGATLKECAQLLQQFGAWTAYDRGSGGDSVEVMEGIVMNVPADIYTNGQNGSERAVSQFILAYAVKNGGTTPVGNLKLTTNDSTKSRSIRKQAPSGSAHVYGSTFDYITAYKYGNAISEESYKYVSDVYSGGNLVARTGDIWHKVRQINGIDLTNGTLGSDGKYYGWTAEIHLGVRQLNVEVITVTPPPIEPPTNFPPELWISMTQGGVQKKYVLAP